MPDVHTRPAEPQDARGIHALWSIPEVSRWAGGSPFDPVESWQARLTSADPSREHRHVAVADGRIVGLVQLEVATSVRLRHLGRLSLAVHPDFRRRGVASQLVAQMISAADQWLALFKLEAPVLAANAPALALWERAGFEVESRTRLDMLLDGELADGVLMGRVRTGCPLPSAAPYVTPAVQRKAAPGEVTVAPTSVDDAEDLATLHSEQDVMWGTLQIPTTSAATWRQRLQTNDRYRTAMMVARVGGLFAGAAGLHGMAAPRLQHRYSIGMSVHPRFQGMGVGDALVRALLSAADTWHGAKRVDLEVYTDNVRAIRLYEKHGFVREGIRRLAAFRGGGYADTIVMARTRGGS